MKFQIQNNVFRGECTFLSAGFVPKVTFSVGSVSSKVQAHTAMLPVRNLIKLRQMGYSRINVNQLSPTTECLHLHSGWTGLGIDTRKSKEIIDIR